MEQDHTQESLKDIKSDIPQNLSPEEDDVSIEPDESGEGAGSRGGFHGKDVREQLKKCQETGREYLAGWQRMKADFINAQKQHQKQLENTRERTVGDTLAEFLPILDSFDMAMMNKETWESVPETWRMGVEYIHSQLIGVFRRLGCTEISPRRGDPFDARIHAAVGEVPAESAAEDGVIAGVVQKGYEMSGTILRPAGVKVAVYRQAEDEVV